MQQHRIDKKKLWFFTLLQQPQTVSRSKKQKKVRTAGKTNLNKDFRDQWRVTTNSNSPVLKIMAPVPSKRASVSIYKAQMHGFTGVLACCFDLLCPGQHSMPSVKQTEHKHDQQVRSSLSGAGPCLLQVCKCFVTLF